MSAIRIGSQPARSWVCGAVLRKLGWLIVFLQALQIAKTPFQVPRNACLALERRTREIQDLSRDQSVHAGYVRWL